MLYGSFIFTQTVRHRVYFLSAQGEAEDAHARPLSGTTTVLSAGLLLVALVAFVGLAKTLTPAVEAGVLRLGCRWQLSGSSLRHLFYCPKAWRPSGQHKPTGCRRV